MDNFVTRSALHSVPHLDDLQKNKNGNRHINRLLDMRWTHRSQHRMEASFNICRTLGSGIFHISHPRIEQLHVHDLPSYSCDPYGYLDQSKSVLKKDESGSWKSTINRTNEA